MANESEYLGLCETCIHDRNCDLPRVYSIPIEKCDTYETNGSKAAATPEKENLKSGNSCSKNSEIAQELGLCMNCRYSETCIFTDTGKQVQHCEEYQVG